jgi:mannose-1-phosphate guanylyltransferase
MGVETGERRTTGTPGDDAERLWAIVLAAGDGKRLAPLTRALYGWELPKQFAVLHRGRSLLQATMDRVAPLVPPERTVVVVGVAQEGLARLQLAEYRGVEIVAQPRNLDTGPGILLPLIHVLARDPGASVVVLPSDHYVADPRPLLGAIRTAVESSRRVEDLLTLLGVVPDRAETDYGWIVPGPPVDRGTDERLRGVSRFVEKPAPHEAQELLNSGALWNTFISVSRASTYRDVARKYLPVQAGHFERYGLEVDRPEGERILDALYAAMEPANFSRAVLERAENLAVLPVAGAGWSDWGNPERVLRTLRKRPIDPGRKMQGALV